MSRMNRSIVASVRTIAVAAAAFAAASPAHAITSFFDGIFNNSDWSLNVITNANGASSSSMGLQFLTGGNPNEYRRVRNQLVATGANAAVIGFHMNVNAFYDPSNQGAITSIQYSEDSINFVSNTIVPGNGQGTGLAILQGGKYYRLNTPSLVMPFLGYSNWTPNSAPAIAATDMWEVTPSGSVIFNSNPDFSASGSVMQLGFWRGNSGNGGYNTDCGIDNWSVHIIPAPGAAALLTLGGLMVSRRRR